MSDDSGVMRDVIEALTLLRDDAGVESYWNMRASSLLARLNSVATDSARMDWLEANRCDVEFYNSAPWEVRPYDTARGENGSGATLRAAIDSAMSAARPQPSPIDRCSECGTRIAIINGGAMCPKCDAARPQR